MLFSFRVALLVAVENENNLNNKKKTRSNTIRTATEMLKTDEN